MRLIPSFKAESLVFSLKIWWILKFYCQLAKNCGMLLRLNMECLMPAVSCMRWSSSLTIGWSKTVLWWNRLMKYILWQKISKNCSKESPCVLPNKFVANGVPNGWAMYAMAYLNILIHLVNNSVIDQIS